MDKINNPPQLTEHLNKAIGKLIEDILKSTLKNPKETAFLLQYLKLNKENADKRNKYQADGKHIPSFLICSITNTCNLFCSGCYARANGICNNSSAKQLLTAAEWSNIFDQAAQLGISFGLLAGGEPMMRRDIIEAAAANRSMIFPIFTNGTLIDDSYLKLFDKCRNLIPILSIEGEEEATDKRRGKGTYQKLQHAMANLHKQGILFGASATMTTENIRELTSDPFLSDMQDTGCRLIFYIEYVPIDPATKNLAPSEKERGLLESLLPALRKQYPQMAFLSFPGDERFMGGCLAAGRGFFHIDPYGAAEPCPFSPYSDRSIKECSLSQALDSPLFAFLQKQSLVGGEHDGGCVLFEHEQQINDWLKQQK